MLPRGEEVEAMPAPVKISDKLLALAREEARGAHRSATAQIEHWATLGRAIEVLVGYRQMLALKRAGEALPVPALVPPAEVHDLLARLVESDEREPVRSRIRAAGGPFYAADSEHPGMVVEIQADGTRTPGHLEGRRFVPARPEHRSRRRGR
jgi:hypothetical protein